MCLFFFPRTKWQFQFMEKLILAFSFVWQCVGFFFYLSKENGRNFFSEKIIRILGLDGRMPIILFSDNSGLSKSLLKKSKCFQRKKKDDENFIRRRRKFYRTFSYNFWLFQGDWKAKKMRKWIFVVYGAQLTVSRERLQTNLSLVIAQLEAIVVGSFNLRSTLLPRLSTMTVKKKKVSGAF